MRCVRPLGGILGVVWQIYKYRKEVNTEEKMKITRKDDQKRNVKKKVQIGGEYKQKEK